MNNLILGGAGFIGQHLSHKILESRQQRVTIIDNLKTSKIILDDFAQYKNLFSFIHDDINEIPNETLLRIFKKQHRIFHLAGSVGVEYIDRNPSETLFNNINLTNKLVPLFQQANKHVIFSSTSEIYGNGPFNEESNASIGPSSKLRWGYATAKLITEFMFRASNFPFTIIRFFNVVGPGQLSDYGMVLPRFIEAAKKGEDLIVHGDGSQVRSFCHVNDAIEALLSVIKFQNELFNIGNDEPITIKDLAEKVIKTTKSKSKIKFVPYEDAFSSHHGDIIKRVPDLTKLKTYTNFTPKYTLDDIIRDMV